MGNRCSRIGHNAIQGIVGYIWVRIFFLLMVFSFIDQNSFIDKEKSKHKEEETFGLGSQPLKVHTLLSLCSDGC